MELLGFGCGIVGLVVELLGLNVELFGLVVGFDGFGWFVCFPGKGSRKRKPTVG